ncbi:MAG: YncE family protein [Ignavibacteria bacterium]|nr:YncE family protein [Ignavibacteria bacterium]
MKFTLNLLLLLTASLIFIQGCYRDEILTPANPSNQPHKFGVYVLSEGRGLADQSALSFLSFYNDDFSYNITFPTYLGLYPDGIINYNSTTLFVTERGSANGPGKIYKIDTNGIILASNSIGLNPYSIAGNNGKAYCTNGPDSSVSVVDLNSLSEIKRIKVGLYPQEILALNNRIFVANTRVPGGSTDSTVSVINAITDQQTDKININISPSSLAVSKDGFLLVGTSGNGGMIYKINSNTFQKVDSFFVNSFTVNDINVDYNTNYVYFISNNNSIVQLDVSSKAFTTIITSTVANPLTFVNGYAFDVKNRKHYLADAKDFTRNGYLYKYNSAARIETGYQTGIAPRRILIRN